MSIAEFPYKGQPVRVIHGQYVIVKDLMSIVGSLEPAKDVANVIVYNLNEFRPHLKLINLHNAFYQLLDWDGVLRLIKKIPTVEQKDLIAWAKTLQSRAKTTTKPDSYIKYLERELARLQALVEPDRRLNREQRGKLRQAVLDRCHELRRQGYAVSYQTVYSALYRRFSVASYKDILAEDFYVAMRFINGWTPRKGKRIA